MNQMVGEDNVGTLWITAPFEELPECIGDVKWEDTGGGMRLSGRPYREFRLVKGK